MAPPIGGARKGESVNDDITKFLQSMGAKAQPETKAKAAPEPPADPNAKWFELIRPTTVNLILGHKGKGKSALGYFLQETVGAHYNLRPYVVNLPQDVRHILPETYGFCTLDDAGDYPDAIILIDEGSTALPAGAKLEELVKGYQALSRQRNQIFIWAFHASSDVGTRILRGVDAILLKEPSLRQIQHGSKDTWWHDLLLEAKGKFKTVADMGQDKRAFTYVDCEEPEFRGLVPNGIPSFWSDKLSCAWGRGDTKSKPANTCRALACLDGSELTPEVKARGIKTEDIQTPEGNKGTYIDPWTNKQWVE